MSQLTEEAPVGVYVVCTGLTPVCLKQRHKSQLLRVRACHPQLQQQHVQIIAGLIPVWPLVQTVHLPHFRAIAHPKTYLHLQQHLQHLQWSIYGLATIVGCRGKLNAYGMKGMTAKPQSPICCWLSFDEPASHHMQGINAATGNCSLTC
ncbi:MAG: hypothetical protein FRX49_05099 [Trebouxia sp. A1-2]|nr:MAG: hypothetical protein FRX49_05099 [Trebouxia sp. A1-2]